MGLRCWTPLNPGLLHRASDPESDRARKRLAMEVAAADDIDWDWVVGSVGLAADSGDNNEHQPYIGHR